MKALIIGVGGQDGSYLVDILLQQGYEVHGIYRRSSVDNLQRIRPQIQNIRLHEGDLLDVTSIARVLHEVKPDEIYNVADQDHVGFSVSSPIYSMSVTAGGVAGLLESVRSICPTSRVFQPCSATMFGSASAPQDEKTPFAPATPYAIAKVAAYNLCQYYRERYGLLISVGIMYNHDSPRRGGNYLLQEIVRKCHAAMTDPSVKLKLSNLDVEVDIGHAYDYMLAATKMQRMLFTTSFCLATGEPFTIRALAKTALELCELPEDTLVEVESTQPATKLTSLCRKARQLLCFDPRHNASTMIHHLLHSMF